MSFSLIIAITSTSVVSATPTSQLLQQCEQHLKADRLTTGKGGGTALSCYEAVLKQEPTNSEALSGLDKIKVRYKALINKAANRGQQDKVLAYQSRIDLVTDVQKRLQARIPSDIDTGDAEGKDNEYKMTIQKVCSFFSIYGLLTLPWVIGTTLIYWASINNILLKIIFRLWIGLALILINLFFLYPELPVKTLVFFNAEWLLGKNIFLAQPFLVVSVTYIGICFAICHRIFIPAKPQNFSVMNGELILLLSVFTLVFSIFNFFSYWDTHSNEIESILGVDDSNVFFSYLVSTVLGLNWLDDRCPKCYSSEYTSSEKRFIGTCYETKYVEGPADSTEKIEVLCNEYEQNHKCERCGHTWESRFTEEI